MEVYVSQLLLFFLLFVRITSLIVVAPILGHQGIPVQVKVAFGLFFSFVLYPVAAGDAPPVTIEFLPFVLLILHEAAAGILIGFATGLLFAGVRYAGELISLETGLSAASMFDPEAGKSTSVISELMYLMMLMVFLLLNGHHFVLEALYLSYTAIPIGGLTLSAAAFDGMLKLTGFIFIVAVKLAAPVMVAMFLISVALSILSRVMPQMNIFMVAFPLKIGAGFFAIMMAAPLLVFVFKKLLATFEANLLELIRIL
ncbi:MAG: flagellar biosynthetic protein FliR [Bacteroidetes bacterium]|nr:flagellar biosynthetic protein FliR [Bacteroidota bacterium]MCW5895099.1 flagellar biosynthetic protein FliR [Bacteroidota bacterium]